MSRIPVIGGYGGFGARLARRLAAAGHVPIVAGRDAAKAARLALSLPGARWARFDRKGDVEAQLAGIAPDLVIDAAGPFQDEDMRVVRACVAARTLYLDLADARGFVTGIGAFDADAREAGVAILSGASSLPALSSAVAARLAEGLDEVGAVEIALSAANGATGGRSVVAAILSYVGRPVPVRRGGRWTHAWGWQERRRADFLFADGTGLRGRRVAIADVPDCALLPGLLPGRPAMIFRAGTELRLHMAMLGLLAWPVRWGWLRSWRAAAGLFAALHRLTAFIGGKRSAMRVALVGRRGAARIRRDWTIVAERGEGAEIPVLAAELLAGRMLAGQVPPGARSAAGLLPLAAFEPAFASLALRHEIVEQALPPPLYARLLGSRFALLPGAVRRLHEPCGDAGASGEALVERGRSPLARLAGRLMGFPPAGAHPLHVGFEECGEQERWTRDFGGHVFASELSARGGELVERFGPLRFRFALEGGAKGIAMRPLGWSLFGLPMPRPLGPRIDAREWEEGGAFRFDVAAALPLVGPVVRYSGRLEPSRTE